MPGRHHDPAAESMDPSNMVRSPAVRARRRPMVSSIRPFAWHMNRGWVRSAFLAGSFLCETPEDETRRPRHLTGLSPARVHALWPRLAEADAACGRRVVAPAPHSEPLSKRPCPGSLGAQGCTANLWLFVGAMPRRAALARRTPWCSRKSASAPTANLLVLIIAKRHALAGPAH
jgi:hypothetical protein